MMDYEKFTRCWTNAQPIVASYIGSMVPDFQQAEDLLQDVAVVLMKKFSEYDPDRPFMAWAMGVARLEILSKRRSHARSALSFQSEILDNLTSSYVEMAPELETRSMALRNCLQEIKGRQREVMKMRYVEMLKPAEIAERTGTAVIATRTMLSRVRTKLRNCIEYKLRKWNK